MYIHVYIHKRTSKRHFSSNRWFRARVFEKKKSLRSTYSYSNTLHRRSAYHYGNFSFPLQTHITRIALPRRRRPRAYGVRMPTYSALY